MNPQSHRLIFNPSRGCLMAVAETSRSCGKSTAAGATSSTRTKRTGGRTHAEFQASNVPPAQWIYAQAATKVIAIGLLLTALLVSPQAQAGRDASIGISVNLDSSASSTDASASKTASRGTNVQASAAGRNGAAGALAGAANEALTKTVNDAIEKALPEPKVADPRNPTNDEKAQLRENAQNRKTLAEGAAQLIGMGAVALGGGSAQDVRLGGAVALNADRNNRQLHPKERAWLATNREKVAKEARASNPSAFAFFTDEQLIALVDKFAIVNLDATATESLIKQYGAGAGPAMSVIQAMLSNDTKGAVFTDDAGNVLQMFTNKTVGRGGATYNPEFYTNSGMYTQDLPTTKDGIADFSKTYGYAPPLNSTQIAGLDSDARAAYGSAVSTQFQRETGGVGKAITNVLEAVGQTGIVGITPGGAVASAKIGTRNGGDNWVANEGSARGGDGANGGVNGYLTNSTAPEVRQVFVSRTAETRAGLPVELQAEGNLALAKIEIPGLPKDMKAFSQYQNGELGFAPRPSGPTILEPIEIGKGGVVNGKNAFLRDVDGEFKILENITRTLGDNRSVTGRIDLFTELKSCTSCAGAVMQFRQRYPGVQLNVFTGKQ